MHMHVWKYNYRFPPYFGILENKMIYDKSMMSIKV
jgi:hypothetical protein